MTELPLASPTVPELSQVALFDDFQRADLAALDSYGEHLSLRPGDALIQEGLPQRYLYVIFSGDLEVFLTESAGRRRITTMHGGQIVGEMAVLNPPHSTAGVEALSEVEAWRLSRANFRRFLDAYPKTGAKLMKLMAKTFAERL